MKSRKKKAGTGRKDRRAEKGGASRDRSEPGNDTADERTNPFARVGVFLLLLAVIPPAVYFNSFDGVFLFDDAHIRDTARLHQLWPLTDVLRGSNRPLFEWTLALNYAWGGFQPWGFHAFNLAVHIAAGWMLFLLLRLVFGLPVLEKRFKPRADVLAFSTALLWLVHPLQTGSVTYIIQRAESLMGLFYLLTVYLSLRSMRNSGARLMKILAVASCAAAVSCKEVAVTAPLMVLAFDRLFFSGSFRSALKSRAGFYTGLAATWLITGFCLILTDTYTESAGFQLQTITWPQYVLTQPEVILHYLKLSVWPVSQCLDYQWPPVRSAGQALWPGAVILGGLLAVARGFLKKQPWSMIGLWFFGILSVSSSVIPIQDVAFEHRMYLPLASVMCLAVLLVDRIARGLAESRGAQTAFVLVVVSILTAVLGYLTVQRNKVYHSEVAMWSDIVRKRPGNARAHNNLGLALIDEGRYDAAVPYLQKAKELVPPYSKPYNNLGLVFLHQGRFDEARTFFLKALELEPDFAEPLNNIGLTYARQKRNDEAIDYYQRAIKADPLYAEARNNLGIVLMNLGRYEEARRSCRKAVRLKPHYAAAYNNLGLIAFYQSDLKTAERYYRKALSLKPAYPKALNNLGVAYLQQGLLDKARPLFEQALDLSPGYQAARENLNDVRRSLSRMPAE